MGSTDKDVMQACTCNSDMAEYAKRRERRKAEIKQFIEFADKAKSHDVESTWLRHAVKGLFAQVFDEV